MSESEEQAKELWPVEVIRNLMETAIPFNQLLRMELVELRPKAILRVPFVDNLVGDAMRPALHGGVLSALLDTACGAAAFGAIPNGYRVSTIDLSIDYVRPAPLADLLATAWVVRSGNRVVLAHCEIHAEGDPQALATGRAAYSVHQPRR